MVCVFDIPVVFNNPTENPTFNEYAAQKVLVYVSEKTQVLKFCSHHV